MLNQGEHRIKDGLVSDHMVVVQDQDDVGFLFHKILQEGHQDGGERGRLGRVQHGECSLPNIRQAGTQRRNDRSPKADRIIIQGVKGKPGDHGFGSVALGTFHRFQALLGL